jgi:hypothetical protein
MVSVSSDKAQVEEIETGNKQKFDGLLAIEDIGGISSLFGNG